MPLSQQELVDLQKDITETIAFARHRIDKDVNPAYRFYRDIWMMIERTNRNMLVVLKNQIERQKK